MFRYYASKQRIQLPLAITELAMTIDTIVTVLTLKLILEYIIRRFYLITEKTLFVATYKCEIYL